MCICLMALLAKFVCALRHFLFTLCMPGGVTGIGCVCLGTLPVLCVFDMNIIVQLSSAVKNCLCIV